MSAPVVRRGPNAANPWAREDQVTLWLTGGDADFGHETMDLNEAEALARELKDAVAEARRELADRAYRDHVEKLEDAPRGSKETPAPSFVPPRARGGRV